MFSFRQRHSEWTLACASFMFTSGERVNALHELHVTILNALVTAIARDTV